jgi:hypothetical protein
MADFLKTFLLELSCCKKRQKSPNQETGFGMIPSLSYPLNYLGSIWHHSEPSDVPYYLNQFLGWDFFAASYSKTAQKQQ